MIVLGIDPGFDRLGFGVIRDEGGKSTWIEHGCTTTEKTASFSERVAEMRDELVSLLYRTKPNLVVVEELFFQTNAKTAMKVGMARGVILLSIHDAGIPLVEITPNQVKQGMTGYGKADKKQIQEMVQRVLKLPKKPTPDDAADALALAIVGVTVWRSTRQR